MLWMVLLGVVLATTRARAEEEVWDEEDLKYLHFDEAAEEGAWDEDMFEMPDFPEDFDEEMLRKELEELGIPAFDEADLWHDEGLGEHDFMPDEGQFMVDDEF